MRRIVGRLTFSIVVFAVLMTAGFAALIDLPPFENQRRAVAEHLLERLNNRPVEITGPVNVSVASLTTVTISNIAVGERGAANTARALHIREAVLSFPSAKLLQGKLEIQALVITGITFELSTANATGDAGQLMQHTSEAVVGMLRSDFAQNVSLRDIAIVRRDDPNGWNGEIVFKDITPVEDETDGSLSVKADGTFNGSPLSVGISVAPPVVGSAGAPKHLFDLGISVAGATATLKGDLDADDEAMDAALTIDLNSFGDLLKVLHLRRDAEGKGQVSMRFSGRFDALKASSIKTTLEFASGERATINGQIANVTAASGIDLTFDVSLQGKGGKGVSVDDEFNLELEAMRGHVLGDLQDLTVEELALTTNIASAQFGEIGPVSIQRIIRDQEGRISLVGLSVKNGPPDDPDLDLTGKVRDVLGRSGITLAGFFKLDVADFLSGAAGSKAVGIVRGQLAVSDTSGAVRVDTFSAKIVGDGPLKIVLDLQPDPKADTGAALKVSLEAPSLDAVAAAAGAAPIGSGSASFKGVVSFGQGAKLSGDARIGNTLTKVDLRAAIDKGRPVLRGDLKSPHLHLSDLRRAARLTSLFDWQPDGLTVDRELAGEFSAEIDIAAASVDGPNSATGALTTHLSYHDRTVALDPLRLDFLGGRIDATLTMKRQKKTPSLMLKGTAAKVDLGALLSEFELTPMITGTLDAGADLTATGETLGALAAALNGGATASISGGKVGTRLIDLAGQDIVSWVFAGGESGDTRLKCADTSLTFKQGVGKIEKLVIETEYVQLVGGGAINLKDERIDIAFQPRPIHKKILEMASPFVVAGPLSSPKISLKPGAAGSRAVAETVTLPLHLLGALLGSGSGSAKADRKPCVVEGDVSSK